MYKQLYELRFITNNLRKQGKIDDQIKTAIGIYLKESKLKINPNGDLDI